MNKNIYLLDCTLRDGGYINNWNFGYLNIKEIVKELVNAKIDIVEFGFLKDCIYSNDKTLFNSIENIKAVIPEKKKNTLYSAMIALGKNEIDANKIKAFDGTVDIIRITFHLSNQIETAKAFNYCKQLKNKGYKICMQPVGSALFSDKQQIKLIEKINQYKPYAFYLVDTLGTLTPSETINKISVIDKHLNRSIKIGFHSHNNLQLSYSNSISLIKTNLNHDLIIDSSLMGMGRGAGNLPTELIANYRDNLKQYNMKSILKIVDDIINPLSHQYKWGYNLYYYISAIHNCHPDYATYLLNKQTLPINQVNELLESIPLPEKHIFNENLIKKLYFDQQINSNCDKLSYNLLRKELKNKIILVIGPGSSINSTEDKIIKFVKKAKPIIISINTIIDKFGLNYLFVSNRKRYYELLFPINYKTIFTSNLPNSANPTYVVSYNDLIVKENEGDNALIMLLNLLIKIKCKNVWLAGFDGFTVGTRNYYNKTINIVSDCQVINKKNECIKLLLNSLTNKIKIHSITPTKYL